MPESSRANVGLRITLYIVVLAIPVTGWLLVVGWWLPDRPVLKWITVGLVIVLASNVVSFLIHRKRK